MTRIRPGAVPRPTAKPMIRMPRNAKHGLDPGSSPELHPNFILTSQNAVSSLRAMRTTLQIEDDVLQAARSLAQTESKSLGQVISELARKGLHPQHREGDRSGFPVFNVPSDAFPITLERVKQAEESD